MKSMSDMAGEGLLRDYAAQYGASIALRRARREAAAARSEAREAKNAKAAFLSGLNHELRTPLNHITGFAGLLREADSLGVSEEKKAEYLDHILQSAGTLLEQINAILEAAGHGAPQAESQPGGTDVVPILRRLLQEHAATLFLGKVDIAEALPPCALAGRDLYRLVQAAFAALISEGPERQAIGLSVRSDEAPQTGRVLTMTFALLSANGSVEPERLRDLRAKAMAVGARLEVERDAATASIRLTLPVGYEELAA